MPAQVESCVSSMVEDGYLQKKNKRTGKNYTRSELYAICTAQYNRTQNRTVSNFCKEKKLLDALWTREYINKLPNSSFAVIEPAYLTCTSCDQNLRRLPFRDENGRVNQTRLEYSIKKAQTLIPLSDSITTTELRLKALRSLKAYERNL